MFSRKVMSVAFGLIIDNEVDVSLAKQHHVFRAMISDVGKPH